MRGTSLLRRVLLDDRPARIMTWLFVIYLTAGFLSTAPDLAARTGLLAIAAAFLAWEGLQYRLPLWGSVLWAIALTTAGLTMMWTWLLTAPSAWGMAVLALVLPMRWSVPVLGVVATTQAWLIQQLVPPALIPQVVLSQLILTLTVFLLQRLARATRQLRDARAALANTEVDAERDRLAQQLNTMIGHTLHQVGRQTTQAKAAVPAAEDAVAGQLDDIAALVERGLDQLQLLSFEPVPSGLEEELRTAQTLSNRLGVALTASVGDIDEAASTLSGLLLREAVTNMFKHSDPTRAVLVTRQDEDGLLFSFVNDGVSASGSDPNNPSPSPTATAGSSGQRRWRDEVARLGGTVTTEHLHGERYRVLVRVPAMQPAVHREDLTLEGSTHG
ncbi:sensor histidine kinase [Yimella sp. cx-51]|uniref:sensor histidine kinase n=1 Tax=Yimella sp. cx-51 TaxID=2770551 RepID=UPI00165E798A|nr:hypothetical protein [Yimella sp. cx-51]MBC9956533.1 hypothetical protein [Yimella sp. cx-51]QTH38363.1 hypothetical protein J5M86_01340 [Yimella sp. cx-51]